MLTKARLIPAKVYGWRHPNEPWMAPGAVRWLDRHLEGGDGVEWGSGRSTAWFARRLDRLVSVEHDRGWYERVAATTPVNVDLRHVALDHPEDEPTVPTYDPIPAYVGVAEEMTDLSLAVVDGHYRQACIRAVLPKMRAGGLLVVDNTDWLPREEWGVPDGWPLRVRARHGYGETSVWSAP